MPSATKHAHAFMAGVVDLVFPPRCLACGELAEPFCGECREGIEALPDAVPIPLGFEDARCIGVHLGPLREAVLALKFRRKTALARPLGRLLAEVVRTSPAWSPHALDALVPMPLHWTRQFHRGFNQSELLAEALGKELDVPVLRALRRARGTAPQVGRSREQRLSGIHGLLAARPSLDLTGKHLVLLDDVHTTGATLAEGARALRAAGAAEVRALTLTYEA